MLFALLVCAYTAVVETAFSPELHEAFTRMPRDEFVRYFNSRHYSWKMADYEEYRINGYPSLGAIMRKNNSSSIALKHEAIYKDLPDSFDSRQKWANCPTILEIYNQIENCGSCWTFGAATTASDRTCVHLNKTVRLSELDLECSQSDGICSGGDPGAALDFWINTGLVTQSCKPYDVTNGNFSHCSTKCVDSNINYQNDKHYGETYNVIDSAENEIKAEMFKNGPVETGFEVYEDFIRYKSGVYEHLYGRPLGGHSVRVLGYGVDNGVRYWLAANSWGPGWGENGTFRIKAYQPDIGFEGGMLAPLPKS